MILNKNLEHYLRCEKVDNFSEELAVNIEVKNSFGKLKDALNALIYYLEKYGTLIVELLLYVLTEKQLCFRSYFV